MSRVGKQVVEIPGGIDVLLGPNLMSVKGPKGAYNLPLPAIVSVTRLENTLKVAVSGNSAGDRAMHGLYRSLVQNAVLGVSVGFEKRLELSGVGYQCSLKGGRLELSVGFSKPVVFQPPTGITCVVSDSTHLVVAGVDKQAVGQFAAQVRASRVPDPYKAKGVKYQGEFVRRKAGKAFGSGG